MKASNNFFIIAAAICVVGAAWCTYKNFTDHEVFARSMPALDTGCGQGIAGAMGGVLADGGAFVIGGCNFPEKGPADGGKKVYYGSVWTLDGAGTQWTELKDFTFPQGYGISAGTSEGIAVIGGCNADGALATGTLFKAEKNFGENAVKLPPLPVPMDNFAGASTGDLIFVAGGNAAGTPTNKAFLLDLNRVEDGWQELPDFPGTPRVQPCAVCVKTPHGDAFVLIGGHWQNPETKEAILPRDALIFYRDENAWEKFAAPLDDEISEAGLVGAAATVDPHGRITVFGGVNATIFKNAVEGKYGSDYLRHEPSWYRFNGDVLQLRGAGTDSGFDAGWTVLESVPATARAGATLIKLDDENGSYLYVNGESMPGVRSRDVLKINFKKGY